MFEMEPGQMRPSSSHIEAHHLIKANIIVMHLINQWFQSQFQLNVGKETIKSKSMTKLVILEKSMKAKKGHAKLGVFCLLIPWNLPNTKSWMDAGVELDGLQV